MKHARQKPINLPKVSIFAIIGICAFGLLRGNILEAQSHGATTTQSATKDPHALDLLKIMIEKMGGLAALERISDYRETGTITYSWAGQLTHAVAIVRGRGINQFRLDSQLSNGVRTIGVSGSAAKLKDEHGHLTDIPLHNAINMGAITLPVLKVIAALQDPSAAISYLGPQNGNPHLLGVRIQWPFPNAEHPIPILGHLTVSDFIIDSETALLKEVHIVSHPKDALNIDIPETYELSDYGPIDRILVPHVIVEKLNGQQVWVLQLDNIEFGAGLSDKDFDF